MDALQLLKEKIEKSNPMFTTYESFKRTIEVCIIESEGLGFMAKIDENKIQEIIDSIPPEWKIEDRFRLKNSYQTCLKLRNK